VCASVEFDRSWLSVAVAGSRLFVASSTDLTVVDMSQLPDVRLFVIVLYGLVSCAHGRNFASPAFLPTVRFISLSLALLSLALLTSALTAEEQVRSPLVPVPREQWEPDEAHDDCMTCKVPFSLFRRKVPMLPS
jgi:ABC-type amino acid transport system permease subunit